MLSSQFLQNNSHVIENVLEHRFLYELSCDLLLRPIPVILDISRAEVDRQGIDLVVSAATTTYTLQLKARSNAPAPTSYDISESLLLAPGGCVLWMIYDPATLIPTFYYLLGKPMLPLASFRAAKRPGYRRVWTRNAQHKGLTLAALSLLLFP